MNSKHWCGLLIAVVLLVSCTNTLPANIRTSPTLSALASPLVSPLVSPLSAPSGGELQGPIPTQSPTAAQIEGFISMEGSAPGVFPASLFLGDPAGSKPTGAFVTLDINTAPRGYVKPNGAFVFPNVPPGTYVIMAWSPTGAYTVPDPTTGNARVLEIKGNEHLDVGTISVPANLNGK